MLPSTIKTKYCDVTQHCLVLFKICIHFKRSYVLINKGRKSSHVTAARAFNEDEMALKVISNHRDGLDNHLTNTTMIPQPTTTQSVLSFQRQKSYEPKQILRYE